jgi:hypothetical protein
MTQRSPCIAQFHLGPASRPIADEIFLGGALGSLRRRLGLPGFYTVVHQDHAGVVAVRFFAIFAQVACLVPLPRGQITYEKTANLTKPNGSL